MPSAPNSPRHRRKSSHKSVDLGRISHTSRKASITGQSSRGLSLQNIPHQTALPHHNVVDSSPARPCPTDDEEPNFGHEPAGLGNLADELAEALDEHDGNGSSSPSRPRNYQHRSPSPSSPVYSERGNRRRRSSPDSVTSLQDRGKTSRTQQGRCHPHDGDRMGSGNGRDIKLPLDVRIEEIRDLATESEENGVQDGNDAIINRMSSALQSLPSQSRMENGASRLITAHTALATHISNQARSLQSLVHHIMSPFSIPYSTDDIDDLLPYLSALINLVPSSDRQSLSSLHTLRTMTADLQMTLTYLSDSVHMNRQTVTSSGRKLRAVTELVTEIRQQAEVSEEAIRWIEMGEWERKLSSRNSKKVCREVIRGFEETCQSWRQRLAAGMIEIA